MIGESGGPAWDAAGFARLVDAARSSLAVTTAEVVEVVARVLAEAHEVRIRLGQAGGPAAALDDIRAQFSALVYCGFIAETGLGRLPALVRYLKAILRRLDKMPESAARDAERMAVVHRVTDDYEQALGELGRAGPVRRRRGRCPLDDRGAAGQLVRPDAGHPGAGVGEADPGRPGPAGRLTGPGRVRRVPRLVSGLAGRSVRPRRRGP